jgi:hypothetical protein
VKRSLGVHERASAPSGVSVEGSSNAAKALETRPGERCDRWRFEMTSRPSAREAMERPGEVGQEFDAISRDELAVDLDTLATKRRHLGSTLAVLPQVVSEVVECPYETGKERAAIAGDELTVDLDGILARRVRPGLA